VTVALLETPLHAAHRRLQARFVDFAGWDMPVQYPSGILVEHQAVRTACGLFDLSHMGRVYVRGRDAFALAQACTTRDLGRIGPGEAAYSLLCLPSGGILDDVIGYRLAPDELLFVFNAANREADADHFREQRQRHGYAADVHDATFETALIGVQGPAAEALLRPLCAADLDRLAGYSFARTEIAGVPVLASRTGYTGEDGFELMVDAARAEQLWDALLARPDPPRPCGLGARDTLRTEAAFALYGHEIDRTTNPFEARLGWVVDLDAGPFVGREALLRLKAEPPTRRLVGLGVEAGGVPRPGCPVLDGADAVGRVTSGTFSPTLQRGIALAYVPAALARPGQRPGSPADDAQALVRRGPLAVEVRAKAVPAEVVRLPFVPHRTRARAGAR
jgi:aminomethyltransferase